jgi:hypothetical protein
MASIAGHRMTAPARVIGLLAMLASLATSSTAGSTAGATALSTCPNALDITGYLQDADTGDGDFAAEVEILDEPTSVHDVQIHTSVVGRILSTAPSCRSLIRSARNHPRTGYRS